MSDLGWRADGINRALAAGGVELERYTRPGFVGGAGVRRSQSGGSGSGFESPWDNDPYPDEWDDLSRVTDSKSVAFTRDSCR